MKSSTRILILLAALLALILAFSACELPGGGEVTTAATTTEATTTAPVTTTVHVHTPVITPGKAATCTEIGWDSYVTCTECDYTTYREKAALGHNIEGSECTVCHVVFNPSEGLSFTSNGDGTCYVSGIGTCTDTDIVIPLVSPAGDSVVGIGYRVFYRCYSLTSITIPASVTSIRDDAFRGCSSLTTVTFAEGSRLISIGDDAFSECYSLTTIEIPAAVTSIGSYAFSGCYKLIQKEGGVHYVDKWVVDCDTSATSVSLRAGTVGIGSHAFWHCSSLTTIKIPASVTSIGGGAFSGCSSLTSITIPSSVTSIGSYAFSGCSSLTSITIPASVTNIDSYAFWHCSSLTTIKIPTSVTSIGGGAFYGCSSLTSVTFENTDGWKAGSTALSSSDLANKSTAATYLKSTYASSIWTRN